MKFGICILSLVPCRKEPADQSEIVSQLLFGEHYKVIDQRAKWLLVRNALDRYEGWIDRKQFHEISKEEYAHYDKSKHTAVTNDLVGVTTRMIDQTTIPILQGSTLPDFKAGKFSIQKEEYFFEGNITKQSKKIDKKQLVENALSYLNAPYLWGGRSPFGIDCSGFSQMVYKLSGVHIPRDAYQQAELGNTLSFVEEAEEGDLAFFDNSEGKIIHVGIVLKNNHIIHASGKVRIDRIDHQGIFNQEIKDYSHQLRIIKSIL